MPYTIFHWKYYALYMFCQLCALPHIWKPCLLTDFCFPFLLVPQTTLHIRPLCFMADCLLPHLLITGWLLTIYSIAWFIMPFLGLDATQRGKYDYYSKSCGRSYLPYYFIRVSLVLNLSKCGQVGHEPTGMHYHFELMTSPCLPCI